MKRWYLYAGIFLAVIGILIVVFPVFWVRLVVWMFGLASCAYGVYMIRFTRNIFDGSDFDGSSFYKTIILVKSIVSIIVGLMAMIFPLAFGFSAWTAVFWLLIIYLFLAAIAGFYAASLLKDSGIDRKKYYLENLALIGSAVILIILSPKTLGQAIIRIIGIINIIAGIALALYDIFSFKSNDVEKVTKDEKSDLNPTD